MRGDASSFAFWCETWQPRIRRKGAQSHRRQYPNPHISIAITACTDVGGMWYMPSTWYARYCRVRRARRSCRQRRRVYFRSCAWNKDTFSSIHRKTSLVFLTPIAATTSVLPRKPSKQGIAASAHTKLHLRSTAYKKKTKLKTNKSDLAQNDTVRTPHMTSDSLARS